MIEIDGVGWGWGGWRSWTCKFPEVGWVGAEEGAKGEKEREESKKKVHVVNEEGGQNDGNAPLLNMWAEKGKQVRYMYGGLGPTCLFPN